MKTTKFSHKERFVKNSVEEDQNFSAHFLTHLFSPDLLTRTLPLRSCCFLISLSASSRYPNIFECHLYAGSNHR